MGDQDGRQWGTVVDTPEKDYPPSWRDCEDIRVLDDDGSVLYAGPRWMRCTRIECNALVTHGQIQKGGCVCGQRRVTGAYRLTATEQVMLKRGHYPLLDWEHLAIHGAPRVPQPPLNSNRKGLYD